MKLILSSIFKSIGMLGFILISIPTLLIGTSNTAKPLFGTSTCTGNGALIAAEVGIVNASDVLGTPDGLGAQMYDLGDTLVIDLGTSLDAGAIYTIRWQQASPTPIMSIDESTDGVSWVANASSPITVNNVAYATTNLTANTQTRYVRIANTNAFNVDVDAIFYNSQACNPIEGPLDLPWPMSTCGNTSSILHPGVATITCATTDGLIQPDRFTFAMISLNNLIPASGRTDVTDTDSVYHHPSWHVDSIGNVFGVAINTQTRETMVTASSNYGHLFWRQTAIIRYGDIGGGANDLGAAGTVYRIDPVSGQASVFVQLPQQNTTFSHRDCESGVADTSRTTGVGLGNIAYDSLHNQYFVTNIEDGRIYRVSACGGIMDSYDPFTYDDGVAGISEFLELPYGIAVEPGSNRLFFGVIDTTQTPPNGAGQSQAGAGLVGLYSIDLTSSGGFSGSINNTILPSGATYDNYVNTETLHTNINTGSGKSFTDSTTYLMSDLSFTPSGQLLVGIRVSCFHTWFGSYNHWGETDLLTLNMGTNLYGAQSEYDISVTGDAGNEDGYGGVGFYQLSDGLVHYVATSSDIITELGPHGIAIWHGDTTNSPLTPIGAFSYGLPNDDPKGTGGDIEVFNECPNPCLITSNSPVCSGDTILLSYSLTADSVYWTGPNSYTSSSPSPEILNAVIAHDGLYKVVLFDINGCAYDSCSTSITILQTPNPDSVTYTGCIGDGYSVTVGSSTYNESNPNGIDTLLAANTCDSIVTTTLVFNTNVTGTETYTGCIGDGYSVTVGSSTYNESNPNGIDTLIAVAGCDSIVATTLVFNANVTGTETYTGCIGDGYSVTVGSSTYNESNPNGIDTLVAAAGCDSIVTTTLVFNTNVTGAETYDGCVGDGYSINVGLSNYSESNPVGIDTLVATSGCDSIVNTILVFKPHSFSNVNYNGCSGDGYEVIVNGITYNEARPSGIDTLIGAASNGCDSIITIALVFSNMGVCEFDLALRKTITTPPPYFTEDSIEFIITIFNQGALGASNINLVDYIPTGLILVDSNWTEVLDKATLNNPIDTLASGDSTKVSIWMIIDQNYSGSTTTNYAEISDAQGGIDVDSSPDNINWNTQGEQVSNSEDNQINEDGNIAGNDEDDHDFESITIVHDFDLALTNRVDSVGPYTAGDTVMFMITVYNQGTLGASDIVIRDYIPTGMTNVDGNWTGDQFTIASLASRADTTIKITLVINPSYTGTLITNNAEIISATGGTDEDDDLTTIGGTSDDTSEVATDNDIDDEAPDTPGTIDNASDVDDYDPAQITLIQIYDLAIDKRIVSTGPYLPGDTVTFEIAITNEGTLPASNVYFEDLSPTDLIYVSDNSGDIANVNNLNNEIFEVFSLDAGITQLVQITYSISPSFGDIVLNNRVQIILDDGDDIDSDPTSNDEVDEDGDGQGDDDDEDEVFVEILLNYDLAIEKIVIDAGPVSHGDMIVYKIVVTNQGKTPAFDIEITDTPDPFLTYQGSDVGGNPNITEIENLTFSVNSLLPDAADTIVVIFQLQSGFQDTIIYNDVEITKDDGDDIDSDPDTGGGVDEDDDGLGDDDDEDRIGVEVEQFFDLALFQTLASEGPFAPGDSVTFRITLINQGSLDAFDIQLADYIPEGLTLSDEDWVSLDSLAKLLFMINSLPSGDTITIDITFTIDLDFTGSQIINDVEISSASGGIDIDSNPDANNDDPNGGDNVTDNSNGDEDDADPAEITIFSCSPLPDPIFDPACSQVISSDVLFIIDNSQSIDSIEYEQFEQIIISSIQKVQCDCPLARVAVMHYGGAFGAETFIEYDFDNSGIVRVDRQFCTERNSSGNCNEGGDDLNAAVGDVIGYISDGSLPIDPSNNFSIVIFTDAFGFEDTCSFVNCSVIRPFDNIDQLKANYNAKVTVVGASSQSEESVLALYSSVGGDYNGTLFAQDCASTFDGCSLPRKYIPVEFTDDPEVISDSIFSCVSCQPIILSNVVLETVVDQEICFNLGERAQLSTNVSTGVPPYFYRWSEGLGNAPTHSVAPNENTLYFVTVTDSSGCEAMDSVLVVSEECNDCQADAGQPCILKEECLGNGIAITPESNSGVVIPMGYEELFLLTDSNLIIIDYIRKGGSFSINIAGNYRVHTLVADVDHPNSPDYLDLSIIKLNSSSIWVVANCIADHGICADFDFKGCYYSILGPEEMMCMTFENSIWLCWDGIDNDGDGLIDCFDDDCVEFIVCKENNLFACNDLVDNDNDGLVDCFDPDCFGFELCNERRELCDDGIDNDGDGLIDCEDDSCANDSDCREDSPFTCADGRDNDDDGLIDCQDPECQDFMVCAEYSVAACHDGIDNDQDGLVDCADADCQEINSDICVEAENTEALCNDGIDNDGDGLIDCGDDECGDVWPCYINNTKSNATLNIRVFLEGAYDSPTGYMRTDLNKNGYLPGQKPVTLLATPTSKHLIYERSPWNYDGQEFAKLIKQKSHSIYNHHSVDWVMVSLKTDLDQKKASWRGIGLIEDDGSVKIISDIIIKSNSYYIIVEHRNHTPVISHLKISQVSGSWTYDFTMQDGFGGIIGYGQTLHEDGTYMMMSGNGDVSLQSSSYTDINALDLQEWFFSNGRHSGYYIEDYDMNGDVNVKDRVLWERNNGKFVRED